MHKRLLLCLWALLPYSGHTHDQDMAIRILATSCAACHGPQGNSLGGTPTLAALNQAYFIERMQGFKNGSVPATVMHQHAKGLSNEEIQALASYFAAQSRQSPPAPPQQAYQGAQ